MANRFYTALLCLALVGCDSEVLIAVDVVTDLVPGAEFSMVETERLDGAPAGGPRVSVERQVVTVLDRTDFLEPFRAAEFELAPVNQVTVVVRLLDDEGRRVLERPVLISASESRAVTIVLPRDCKDVVCPGRRRGGARVSSRDVRARIVWSG